MPRRVYSLTLAGGYFAAVTAAWGQYFSIEGDITLSHGAQMLVSSLSEGEKRISLDFRHDEPTASPIRSVVAEVGRSYKVLFERDLRGKDIHVTAETPQGTVLASDYIVTVKRQSEFLNERKSIWAIPLDIRLTTIPDRFMADVNAAQRSLRSGKYDQFFLEIERLLDLAASNGDDIYYRSRQLWAEGLHIALKAGHRPPDSAMMRVQALDAEDGFQRLPQERQYSLFLQLARALSQSQFVQGTKFGGMEQWQLIDLCFVGALQAAKGVKSVDEIARIQVEHVGHLNLAGKDEALLRAAVAFFELMPADVSQASKNQRNNAIPMLAVLADILERRKPVMIFTTEESIEHAANDQSLMEVWIALERHSEPWAAQLPAASKKDVVRRLRMLLDRAKEVVGRTTADG